MEVENEINDKTNDNNNEHLPPYTRIQDKKDPCWVDVYDEKGVWKAREHNSQPFKTNDEEFVNTYIQDVFDESGNKIGETRVPYEPISPEEYQEFKKMLPPADWFYDSRTFEEVPENEHYVAPVWKDYVETGGLTTYQLRLKAEERNRSTSYYQAKNKLREKAMQEIKEQRQKFHQHIKNQYGKTVENSTEKTFQTDDEKGQYSAQTQTCQ